MGERTELSLTPDRITFKSDGVTRRMTLLMDAPTLNNCPIDRLPTDVYAIFDPMELKARMASLCLISADARNYVAVSVSAEAGVMFASSSDNEDMSVVYPVDRCRAVEGTAQGTYPAPFLGAVFKAIPKGLSLQVSLADGMPVLMKFLCDSYSAEFLFAPIIDEDDD